MPKPFFANVALLVGCLACTNYATADDNASTKEEVSMATENSQKTTSAKLYEMQFETIDGGTLNMSDYKGKVVLVVNTASECMFTKQFALMQELWTKYKDKGLVIIAVPSNDFGGQEPGTNEKIVEFCSMRYGVTFPVVKKVSAKGKQKHEFFDMTHESFGMLSGPYWNFYKYIFDKNGNPREWFYSRIDPTDPKVTKVIEQLLEE